jgi:AcrR family transcriptional regulator
MDSDQTDQNNELLDGDDDESLADLASAERVGAIVERVLGVEAAQTFNDAWHAFEEWDRSKRPDEGLRERKKRLTRQRISDVATALFVARGFDDVRVAEIAEAVGVSEKTIYNYFPSKELLVFDQAEEQRTRMVAALRDRPRGMTPTAAFIAELKLELVHFTKAVGKSRLDMLPRFGAMIRQTPALRAAWGDHRHLMVEAVAQVLSDDFGIDPQEPEPLTAARGLVSLTELVYDSQLRHAATAASGPELQKLVEADLDRAARLLDTGLWSLQVMVEGRRTKEQLREAANAAEHSREQVIAALREAGRAWRDLHHEARTVARKARDHAMADAREARDQARAAARDAREQARAAAAEERAAASTERAEEAARRRSGYPPEG